MAEPCNGQAIAGRIVRYGVMQTKTQSLIEAFANIAVGMAVAFGAQLVVFPALGIAVSLNQNMLITCAFTAVSLVRSYALRRFFNWLHS